MEIDHILLRSFRESLEKLATMPKPPKVETGALRRAKEPALEDTESNSLRRAIERSQNPQPIVKKVRRQRLGTYAGANTAANLRSVVRSEEKRLRETLKKRLGPHSRMSMSRYYS